MRLTGHRAAVAAAILFLTSVTMTVVTSTDVTTVYASSITVNTALDIAPNGSYVFPTDGKCSLRAAISAAQNNSNGHDVDCTPGAPVSGVLDVIQIDPSLAGQTLTMSWNNGSGVQPFDVIYDMNNPLEIIGPNLSSAGFVIDANNAVRPFGVGFGGLLPGSLKLANLTIRGGNGNDNGAFGFGVDGDGGAIFLGATDTGGPIVGSHLTLDNVVLRDNIVTASARGGAIWGNAPVITNNGGAYISNRANGVGTSGAGGGRGGAIFIMNGPATFNGYAMLMENNSAAWAGGAIATNPGNESAFVHLERSLLKGNTAGSGGGGVVSVDSGGYVGTVFELHDSTVTGNSSVFLGASTGQLYDYRRNTFVDTGEVMRAGGGLLVNSIVKGTSSCVDSGGPQSHSGSRNLLDPSTCAILSGSDVGDVTNLGPLAQNGGPEVQQTFALLVGSNAIDNGDAAYCGTIDARSVARGLDGNNAVNSPQVGDCDIGAYEYARYVVNFVTGTSSVNENAGSGTVGVKLKILNAADNPLPSALTVNVGVGPGSSAWLGNGTDPFDDLNITGGAVVFPAGSADGAVVNVPITVFQDDIAELLGEQAFLQLTGSPTPGVAIAEPNDHELNIQDDDQPGVTVTESGGSTAISEATPGVGDTITVALQSRPNLELVNALLLPDRAAFGDPADVEMTITPDRDCVVNDGSTTGTSASPLVTTILNANWQTGKSLTVFAVDDLWDEDFRDESAPHTCELRFTFSSADPLYDATQDAFEVDVTDNDVAGVNVDFASGSGALPEGGVGSYTYDVTLDTPPDPGKPLPVTPRGPTGILFQAGTDCLVNGQANVTLQFTGATWNSPQTLTITPVDNQIVQLLHTCTIHSSISSPDPVYANLDDAPVFSGTPPTLTVDIQDYDPPTVTDDPPFVDITAVSVDVSEATPGTADSFSVVLRRQPTSDVEVEFAAPIDGLIGGRQLQVSTGGPFGNFGALTFTPANWNVPQTVQVSAVDDDYDELDTHGATVDVWIVSTAPGFSSAALRKVVVDGVESSDTGTVPVNITDDDTSEVLYVASGGTTVVAEPAVTDTIAISLATHPYASVTLMVTTDSQCAVDGSSVLTFPAAAWNVAQTLTLVAVDDAIAEADPHQCTVDVDVVSTDLLYDVLDESFDIDVDDDEIAGVEITAGAPLSLTEAGGTDTFDVVLTAVPSADVTVQFTVAGGQLVDPADVLFTPATWDQPQTVTVSAVDDLVDEADPHAGMLTVGVSSTALGYATAPIVFVDSVIANSVSASIVDNDTAGIEVAGDPFAAAENGGTDTFTVVLTSQPVADVDVNVGDDGLCDASPAQLTFTDANWDQPQTVTVTGLDDDIDHAQPCTLPLQAVSADANYQALATDVAGQVIDDDSVGVTVTVPGGTLTVAEHGVTSDTYAVVLNSQPTADVDVAVATVSGDIAVSSSLTFTPANWSTPQTVTVTAVDDAVVETPLEGATVTHDVTSVDAAYDALVVASVSVNVADDDTATTLIADPSPAGDAETVTLTATVSGGDGSPTGTVQFILDGNPVDAPVPLVAGEASTEIGPLAKGTYALTAEYAGDADNDPSSGTAGLEVTATPEPDNDEFSVAEDSGSNDLDVLDGDVDDDGDSLEIISHTAAAHGTVACTAAGCTYTPGANYHGDDSFTYTVSDGVLSATATVTVHVTPVNDPPSPAPVSVSVVANGVATFELLTNATDVDGDTLTVVSYTQPAHGSVVCTLSGHCTYTPTAGYVGPDTFTFVLSDGAAQLSSLATAQGSVSITVIAAPSTTRPRGIPATGGNPGTTIGGAVLLLGCGVLLLGLTRRKRALSSR